MCEGGGIRSHPFAAAHCGSAVCFVACVVSATVFPPQAADRAVEKKLTTERQARVEAMQTKSEFKAEKLRVVKVNEHLTPMLKNPSHQSLTLPRCSYLAHS